MKILRKLTALVLLVSMLTACSTMQPVPLSSNSQEENLRPGDNVRITMKDGRQLEMQIKEFTTQQVVGETISVPLVDIRQLERREFSKGKTYGLLGALVGGSLLVGVISFFATFRP